MSRRRSPHLDSARAVHHNVHHNVHIDPPDAQNHYDDDDDDEALYPTASPPPDDSVLRRAGFVFVFSLSLSNSPTELPLSSSLSMNYVSSAISRNSPQPRSQGVIRTSTVHLSSTVMSHLPGPNSPPPLCLPPSHVPHTSSLTAHAAPGPAEPSSERACPDCYRNRNSICTLSWHVCSFSVTIIP